MSYPELTMAFRAVELHALENNRYALYGNGKVLYIGHILYHIIRDLQKGVSLSGIRENVRAQYGAELEEQRIATILKQDILDKIYDQDRDGTGVSQYIRGRIRLLGAEQINRWAQTGKHLFSTSLMIPLMLVGGIATFSFLFYLIFHQWFAGGTVTIKDSLYFIVGSYAFVAIVGVLHEMGHASAAARFNMPTKEIGLGFYLVFPVFFADVTKIWLLDKKKRVMVNCGGIYFQLIINLVLLAIYALVQHHPLFSIVVKAFFVTNTLMCLYATNPFLRNDGYWLYSDGFDLPNLTAQARAYPKYFYRRYIQGEDTGNNTPFKKEIPLFAYSSLYFCIMAALMFALTRLTIKNYHDISGLLYQRPEGEMFEVVRHYLRVFFAAGINLFFLYNLTTSVITRTKKYLNQNL